MTSSEEAWLDFLRQLKEAGGSTDMQTSKTGRYPFLFHFQRGQAASLVDVVIYPYCYNRSATPLRSPPRDWSTKEKLVADYKALAEHGGVFNDTREALGSP